ncbi:MAG: DUF2384 domain-containing protein [Sedimentisphaerales bacterium]|nr:DUF2384 domain-containing protein [Sedimentisphaerales bacterium]
MTQVPNIVPASDDLSGWKAAERRLGKRINDRIHASGIVSQELFRRYFGGRNAEYLLEKYKSYSVLHAFIEWLVSDYRPVLQQDRKKAHDKNRLRHKRIRRGRTIAEKMLAEGLPADEAVILEACSQANPSLFRVNELKIGSTLAVEDILLGGEYVIQDKALSGCVQAGDCLAGRIYPVSGFHFFSPMGPPLPIMLITEATGYLESIGVKISREGLLCGADKFGLLWNWWDKQSYESRIPLLRNTDGEDLIWQTASFSVSDENAVREAFARREDIEYNDEEDDYTWFRVKDKPSKKAKNDKGINHKDEKDEETEILHLGSLRFVLNELILEVNSLERLEAARAWLENIPGVKFLDAKSRDFNQEDFEVPMDDRLGPKESVEMTPELASYVQESFNRHYMDWLDSPLPVLDGKTPRQMCKTKAGRNKVARLIRTIPLPVGNPGVEIKIPRREMLRELGIESE